MPGRTSIAIVADGITVESDGPVEALDAVQRDVIEWADADDPEVAATVARTMRELIDRARKR